MSEAFSIPAALRSQCYRPGTLQGSAAAPAADNSKHSYAPSHESRGPGTYISDSGAKQSVHLYPISCTSLREMEVKPSMNSYPAEVQTAAAHFHSQSEPQARSHDSQFKRSGSMSSDNLQGLKDTSLDSKEQQSHPDLQTELKQLRNALEKKHASHQQIGALVQANLMMSDNKSAGQHVKQVQHMASEALEREVKELCATVASQQAEQAIFLQMLTGEIDVLKERMQAACLPDSPDMSPSLKSVHSEIDSLSFGLELLRKELSATKDLAVFQKSSMDAEIKQLRLEIDGKISQQVMTALDGEVKSLRQELDEKELHALSRIAQFGNSLQEHRREALETLHKVQADMEHNQKRQDEEYLQAMRRSHDLTMDMQTDMTYLRGLFEKNSNNQEDPHSQHESLQMFWTLKGEVDHLRRQHEDMGAALALKDSDVQLLAELRELQNNTLAHKSDVKSIYQQLNEQKAQLGALSSASQVFAHVKDTETTVIQRIFEKQLQHQADAIKSLFNRMDALSEGLPTQLALCASVPGDADVALLKSELDALKLQDTLQQSLDANEVAKETAAMHGQLHQGGLLSVPLQL